MLSVDDPPSIVNVGSGEEISIRDLTERVARTVGFEGRIVSDLSKPDGAPRKVMDSSYIRSIGWAPRVSFESGLATAYEDFLETLNSDIS